MGLLPQPNPTPGNHDARPAQARGLPARLTTPVPGVSREVVIENDIAWRLHALIDFMVGKPLVIQSLAEDPARAAALTNLLNRTFEHNGGHGFFQDLALLGSIYGHVDVLLRVAPGTQGTARQSISADAPDRLEIVEAPRAVPLLDPGDYRWLDAFIVHHTAATREVIDSPWISRVLRRGGQPTRGAVRRTEVWTAGGFEVFHAPQRPGGAERRRVASGVNPLGRVPVVHFQNLPQPFHFEGLSDVEPLDPAAGRAEHAALATGRTG